MCKQFQWDFVIMKSWKHQCNFNQNIMISIQENVFQNQNAICKMLTILFQPQYVNSLWLNDVIWSHQCRPGSTLVQVMVCSLMALRHYLNQCWLLISEVLWHSPERNFTASTQATILYNEFVNYSFEITATSPRGQWVNELIHSSYLLYTASCLSCSLDNLSEAIVLRPSLATVIPHDTEATTDQWIHI